MPTVPLQVWAKYYANRCNISTRLAKRRLLEGKCPGVARHCVNARLIRVDVPDDLAAKIGWRPSGAWLARDDRRVARLKCNKKLSRCGCGKATEPGSEGCASCNALDAIRCQREKVKETRKHHSLRTGPYAKYLTAFTTFGCGGRSEPRHVV